MSDQRFLMEETHIHLEHDPDQNYQGSNMDVWPFDKSPLIVYLQHMWPLITGHERNVCVCVCVCVCVSEGIHAHICVQACAYVLTCNQCQCVLM